MKPTTPPCAEATIRATPEVPACAERKGWVLAAAVLGSTMAFLDESVVNVALPRIEAALDTTLPAMQWIINAYTLCISALLLIGGAAADQVGRRKIFLIGITIFAMASLGCGFAPHIAVLIVARAVQGVGAALLIPCSLALIGAAYDEKERGAAIGIWSGASAIAAGGGPLLGGWLVDHWSWRGIFLINPLLALPTLWIAIRHVPESRDASAQRGLDWPAALLAFGGLGGLVFGLIAAPRAGWGHPVVVASLALGVLLLVAFVQTERRSRAPMMPLQLFHSRTFSGITLFTLFLYGALGGALFFLPFLLIQAHGYSATAAGAVYLPFTVILGLLSRWSGGLADRFGTRVPLIVGPLITALGFALLAVVSGSTHYWAFLPPMTVVGFGMAITVAPLTTAVVNSVAERQIGVASGINNAVASVASLLFVAVLGSIALGAFGRSLDRHLVAANPSPEVRAFVDSTRQAFAPPSTQPAMSRRDRQTAQRIIAESYVETIRLVMFIAAAACFASALTAALTIGSLKEERMVARPRSS
ncbi:MAG: drug resistance transporter, EmrB/QacA subfamily [Gammaproteobacteria bacterium]|jgi:EmrB/QacA subfamily drug resistance transporter|nr:drug resistance transporter, EmrB/QacA subfamily [Gammaproteobacteria bacterium]